MNWQLLLLTLCSASAIFSLFVIAAMIVSGRISRAEELVDQTGERM